MTRWAKILRPLTLITTSHSSRWRRRTFSSCSVTRGCFSEVCDSLLAGDGGRSDISTSPILLAARRSGAEAQPHTVSIFVIFVHTPRGVKLAKWPRWFHAAPPHRSSRDSSSAADQLQLRSGRLRFSPFLHRFSSLSRVTICASSFVEYCRSFS
uniref:Putative secreted protein n=1 Tax=Anopheles darlingi TaxID=43151 RepID=A0A2M4D8U0_ANODA